MNIETVNELIASLESAGELSIREQKFLKLAKAYQQLAAENVQLKSSRAILAENALESCNSIACAGFRHEAIMRGLYASTGNGNKYPKPITTLVDEAMRKLETPATDRIVAGIKADGVEEFSKTLEGAADICGKSKAWDAQENLLDFAARGFEFAKQLREGADK
jgi:hypothetical protein|nr:MAG TPA: hypothetical protein [Bacteriophage sp.]